MVYIIVKFVLALVLVLTTKVHGRTVPKVTVLNSTVALGKIASITYCYSLDHSGFMAAVIYRCVISTCSLIPLVSSFAGPNPKGRYSLTVKPNIVSFFINEVSMSDLDFYYQLKVTDSNFLTASAIERLTFKDKPDVALGDDVTVGPEEDFLSPEVSANPNDVTSPPGINNTGLVSFTMAEVSPSFRGPCVDNPCENKGICEVVEGGYNCIFPVLACQSCSSIYNMTIIIGIFFVGIFVGIIVGRICYKIFKQKTHANKDDTGKRKQEIYMEYKPTGNTHIYQDIIPEEEAAYANIHLGMN